MIVRRMENANNELDVKPTAAETRAEEEPRASRCFVRRERVLNGCSRLDASSPNDAPRASLSGTSTLTVDKIWTQLLSDYSAAQKSFDAASDVLHAHLAMNTLPTSNEFLAEERARAKIIVARARLCGDWPKN
jgi:hypothetical protein